jgi:hypothetical protein
MPTYTEAANLPRMAETVLGLPLPGLHLKIVDDSSRHGTGRLAEELAEKYNASGRTRRISVTHALGMSCRPGNQHLTDHAGFYMGYGLTKRT